MKVKEFINLIDLESINNQEITIIIPIKEKYLDKEIVNIGDCTLSENEKVVLSCDEASIYEENKYAPFGIEPCFKSEDEESEDYCIIDVRKSDDYFNYVYDEDGAVWVIIDFSS